MLIAAYPNSLLNDIKLYNAKAELLIDNDGNQFKDIISDLKNNALLSALSLVTNAPTIKSKTNSIDLTDCIKWTDSNYLAYSHRITTARETRSKTESISRYHKLPPLITHHARSPAPFVSVELKAAERASQLTKLSGLRIEIVGSQHTETKQYDYMIALIKKLKESGDTRKIIVTSETPKTVFYSKIFDEWSAASPAKKKEWAGKLGNKMFGGTIQDTEYFVEIHKNLLKKINNNDIISLLPIPYFYNAISRINPNCSVVSVCQNRMVAELPYDNNERLKYVSTDTSMGMNIDALIKKYPDAIVIVDVGNSHARKMIEDHLIKLRNISPNVHLDGNDSVAEQLADLYGFDRVHTTAMYPTLDNEMVVKTAYGHNKPGDWSNYHDQTIPIISQASQGEWHPPASWIAAAQ